CLYLAWSAVSHAEHGPAFGTRQVDHSPRPPTHTARGDQSHLDATLRPAAGGIGFRFWPQRKNADASRAARLAGGRIRRKRLADETHSPVNGHQWCLSQAIGGGRS